MEPLEHIEDIESSVQLTAPPLDNAALINAGMVPVKAWVRSKQSANALRVAASKEKKEREQKIKQLNIPAPTDEFSRAALKEVANALCAGKLTAAELLSVVRGDAAKMSEVMKKGGLRAAILRNVLGF